MKREYRIYPTLLDKWTQLCDYRQEVEQPWNMITEKNAALHFGKQVGDYILDEDEMYDKLERELLDAINRVEHEPSEAADRGTAFNEAVDLALGQATAGRCTEIAVGIDTTRAKINGTCYSYDNRLIDRVAADLSGSLCQYYLEAPIEGPDFRVILYGYPDYWRRGEIIDLKTTKSYEYGNYDRKWQRHVYPYCAIESGKTTAVDQFVFYVVEWRGGKKTAASGNIFNEVYSYNHNDTRSRLLTVLEGFTAWLDRNRARITDEKIFNHKTIDDNGI